ncbi:molecular chaperone DnaJ [Micromonospora sp. NBC_01699]|uniref:molecular chaperone DnaJ n=1 Tax=Micromonospora sp. NBC_01699 TaxID=2975984 RepID=UPI002E3381A1|nr:molecular chaperone DnaJ [Micromonospora sp. NBC_01699]
MTFAEAAALVDAARTPGDLFGGDQPAVTYRKLARLLHPDAAPAGRTVTATAAFARLSSLWATHQGRGNTTLTTRRHRYTLGDRFATGDLANLYRVRYDGRQGLLKLPRQPAANDLLDREATALVTLRRNGDPRHRAYAPELVESFRHEDPTTGVRRTANVLSHCAGLVPLTELARAYPDGLDPRDVAWIWRRLLVALGWAHRAGVVHGAVLPEHVLIEPDQHGVVLVDWCYSVTTEGGSVPALVARYRDWYPPEVAKRAPATPATDIHLASGCMRWLMGTGAPDALFRFIRGCTQPSPRRRPQDAWRLLAELDELLEKLYGPRRFRRLVLPTTTV